MICSIVAVSYTHLDVYKRQLSYYPFDFAQIMLNYMDVVHEPGMVGYEKLTKANVPVIIMAVSYTHLDVYKRQNLINASGLSRFSVS